jgi:hypothetical protein
VCAECASHALIHLRDAADAYPELATTTEIATRPSIGRSGHVFAGSPSPACDAADVVFQTLRDAEDWLRIELDHQPAKLARVHHPDVVTAARAYLERHHDEAMRLPWAPGYCERLKAASRTATAHLPAERGQTVHLDLDGLCPGCKARALARISGTDRVTCRACGEGMPWDDYEGHMEHLRRVAASVRAKRHVAARQHADSDAA